MVVKLKQNVTHDGQNYGFGDVIEKISTKQAKRLVKLGVADFIEQYHFSLKDNDEGRELNPSPSNEGIDGHENEPPSNVDGGGEIDPPLTNDEDLDEFVNPPPSIDEEIDDESELPKPKHVGGGVYELPNGERIKGKTEAYEAWDKLNEDI